MYIRNGLADGFLQDSDLLLTEVIGGTPGVTNAALAGKETVSVGFAFAVLHKE